MSSTLTTIIANATESSEKEDGLKELGVSIGYFLAILSGALFAVFLSIGTCVVSHVIYMRYFKKPWNEEKTSKSVFYIDMDDEEAEKKKKKPASNDNYGDEKNDYYDDEDGYDSEGDGDGEHHSPTHKPALRETKTQHNDPNQEHDGFVNESFVDDNGTESLTTNTSAMHAVTKLSEHYANQPPQDNGQNQKGWNFTTTQV